MQNYISRINNRLTQLFAQQNCDHPLLIEAMQYSCLNGGKRLRALLVYATAALFHKEMQADIPACAVEMIHAYSLIHDDLPAMDNSDLRRGKASCHKAFGEAVAILAGDALQALAFEILIKTEDFDAAQKIKLLEVLATACGAAGMVGGQMLDILPDTSPSLESLIKLNQQKTGALISASVQMGALVGQANPQILGSLLQFSELLGLAYQIQDDILDIEQSTEILGKPQGLDQSLQKVTFPQLIGLEACKNQVQALKRQAENQLASFSADFNTKPLENLMTTVFSRQF